eukprot:14548934-Alexandrium_andersonii.AAC.1
MAKAHSVQPTTHSGPADAANLPRSTPCRNGTPASLRKWCLLTAQLVPPSCVMGASSLRNGPRLAV